MKKTKRRTPKRNKVHRVKTKSGIGSSEHLHAARIRLKRKSSRQYVQADKAREAIPYEKILPVTTG